MKEIYNFVIENKNGERLLILEREGLAKEKIRFNVYDKDENKVATGSAPLVSFLDTVVNFIDKETKTYYIESRPKGMLWQKENKDKK